MVRTKQVVALVAVLVGMLAGAVFGYDDYEYKWGPTGRTVWNADDVREKERDFQRHIQRSWDDAFRQQDRQQWYQQGGRNGPPPDFYPERWNDDTED